MGNIVLTRTCIQVHTNVYTRIPTQAHTQTIIQEHKHTHVSTLHTHVSKHTHRDIREHTVTHSMSLHSCCDKDTSTRSREAFAMGTGQQAVVVAGRRCGRLCHHRVWRRCFRPPLPSRRLPASASSRGCWCLASGKAWRRPCGRCRGQCPSCSRFASSRR